MPNITEAELLTALQAAYERPAGGDDAMTSRELSEQLGCSTKVLFRIMDTMPPGTFETVWVYRQNRNGINTKVPAYRSTNNNDSVSTT